MGKTWKDKERTRGEGKDESRKSDWKAQRRKDARQAEKAERKITQTERDSKW